MPRAATARAAPAREVPEEVRAQAELSAATAPEEQAAQAAHRAEAGSYTILLAHRPEQLELYASLGFDLVLANIVADVILSLSAFARDFMSESGVFICSGIIDGRRAEVEAALCRSGFAILRACHEDEWNCYLCK